MSWEMYKCPSHCVFAGGIAKLVYDADSASESDGADVSNRYVQCYNNNIKMYIMNKEMILRKLENSSGEG